MRHGRETQDPRAVGGLNVDVDGETHSIPSPLSLCTRVDSQLLNNASICQTCLYGQDH